MKDSNPTLIVIVLYKMSLQESVSYNTALNSLSNYNAFSNTGFYVWDNSPDVKNTDSVACENILEYVHSPENAGLSVAYNSAAKYASDNGFKWMLILDQDTTLPIDFFEKTTSAIEKNPNEKLFAPTIKSQTGLLISPFRVIAKVGKRLKNTLVGQINSSKYAVINSGILVNLEAYNKVGGYINSVKLDFSDTVFLERYSNVYGTIFITDALCSQELSTFSPDINSLKQRFALFCQGAKSCPQKNLKDKIGYNFVVMKRLLSLTIRCKSLTFLNIYFKNYVKR